MPAQLHIARAALTVRLTVPDAVFKQHFTSSISGLGTELAKQVHNYVTKQQTGYYPPLDYVQQQQAADDYLLDAVAEVSKVAMEVTHNEALSLLQPVFSSVKIESLQSTVYTMPAVRVGQTDAINALARHYTPGRVKFDLNVSLIQKQAQEEGMEKRIEGMVLRWLGEAFEDVETGATRLCT